MKRVVIQIGIFLILLLIFTLVRLPFASLSENISESIKSNANSIGIHLEMDPINLSFPLKAQIEHLKLLIPSKKTSIPLSADNVRLSSRLLPFLQFELVIDGIARAYEGTIKSESRHQLFGDLLTLKLNFNLLQLSSHPILASYGISGLLNLEMQSQLMQTAQVFQAKSGRIELSLDNVSYRGGDRVLGIIALPRADDVNAKMLIEQAEERVSLKLFELNSSLGTIKGSGELYLREGDKIDRAKLNLNLKLTPDGAQVFNGYLALRAGEPVETLNRRWKLSYQLLNGGQTTTFNVISAAS